MKRVGLLCLLGLLIIGGSGCATVEPYIYGEADSEAPEVEEEPEERDDTETEEPTGESVPEETGESDESSSEVGSDSDGDTEAVSNPDHPEPEKPEPEAPDSPSDSEDPPDPEPEFRFGAYQETSGTLIDGDQTELPYGTHALSQEQNGRDIVYALRSDRVDLTQYVGMLVWIRGRLIRGYPENGGPEFLQVESVTPLQIGVLPAMTGY